MCTDEECEKQGFVGRCKQGCHHCAECGLPCYTYHEEDCLKAVMIPCDNGDGRAGAGTWADGKKLCEQCFDAMGPDPRYTAEQNEENKQRRVEDKKRREELKLNPPPPLTPEQEEQLNKIFGENSDE